VPSSCLAGSHGKIRSVQGSVEKEEDFKFQISNIPQLNRLQFTRNLFTEEDFAPKRGIDKNGG